MTSEQDANCRKFGLVDWAMAMCATGDAEKAAKHLAGLASEAIRERDAAIARAEAAERELAAERERSHKLVSELRAMVIHCGMQARFAANESERRAWSDVRSDIEDALAEYEGEQADGE